MTSPTHAHRSAGSTRLVIPAWAWAVTVFALLVLYLMGQDNGVVLAQLGDTAHEFFHDARHSLGMPCH